MCVGACACVYVSVSINNLHTHLKNAHRNMWPTAHSEEEDKTPAGTKLVN